MSRYQNPWPIPDEHMRMVGIIAMHWEDLDILLQRSVAEVMSMNPSDVRLLTENLSVAAKLDILSAHAHQALPKPELKLFNKAIAVVQAAYGRRNAFVHAKWDDNDKEPDKPWRYVVRTKGGRMVVAEIATPIDELVKAATEIWDAGKALAVELQKYGMLQP